MLSEFLFLKMKFEWLIVDFDLENTANVHHSNLSASTILIQQSFSSICYYNDGLSNEMTIEQIMKEVPVAYSEKSVL